MRENFLGFALVLAKFDRLRGTSWRLLRMARTSFAGSRHANTIFCIIGRVNDPKPVEFRGSALDDLRFFPISARRDAGFQIDLVQRGEVPDDWKPMPTIGQGVQEIRIRDVTGAFRVVYVAKFASAVYVLHCFQKKRSEPASLIWSWPSAGTVSC